MVAHLLLAGCGGNGSGETEPHRGLRIWDSAGIRIVEHGAGLARLRFAAVDTASVEIGVVEGEPAYQLHNVVGAVRLGDGRIVIADGGSREVRVYGASGRHLTSFGGAGSGPGEFDRLSGMARSAGDTLVAWDRRAHRLTVFSADGGLVRTTQVHTAVRFTRLFGALSDGTALLQRAGSGSAPAPGTVPDGAYEYRDTAEYVLVRPDGTTRAVGRVPGIEWVRVLEGLHFPTIQIHFGREAYGIAGADRIYLASNDAFDLGVYDTAGTLESRIRRSDPPRAVTGAELDRARTRMQVGIPDADDFLIRAIERTPHRSTHPAFGRLLFAADGRLWVASAHTLPGAETEWLILAPDGSLFGQARTPAGLRVLDAGADYVLGLYRDELDIQYVRLHALVDAGWN